MRRAIALLALLCAGLTAAAETRVLRDPFARPLPRAAAAPEAALAAEAPEPPPLHLRAVILHGARSLANIDGAILAVGEQFGEGAGRFEIVRIDARGVLVSRGGKQQLLLLNEKDKQ